MRRVHRWYRLRDAQIDAVTRFNHLGVIGASHRGDGGCYASLKPPWHTRTPDIITAMARSAVAMSTSCAYEDLSIDRRLNQYRMDIFQLEKSLPTDALTIKIDRPDFRDRKFERHRRNLEKARQVTFKNSLRVSYGTNDCFS